MLFGQGRRARDLDDSHVIGSNFHYRPSSQFAKKMLDISSQCGDSFAAIRPGPSLDWLIELECSDPSIILEASRSNISLFADVFVNDHENIVSVVHLKVQTKHLLNVIKLAIKLAKKFAFPVQFDLEPNTEKLEDRRPRSDKI